MAPSTSTRSPRSRPFRLAGLLVATAAATLATWSLLPQAPIGPEAGAAPAAGLRPVAASAVGTVARQALLPAGQGCYLAPVGATFAWRFRDENRYEVQSREAHGQQAVTVRTEATVTTTVLDRRAGEILVQSHLDGLRFLGEDGHVIAGDPVQESYAAAARTDVAVRLQDDGRVLGYGFAAGLNGDQRNFLRGVLGVFAITVPLSAPESWDAREADSAGEFEARYQRLPQPAGATMAVRRSKLRYLTMGKGELPAHELRGATEATFGGCGWLGSVRIDEGMTLALPLLDLATDTHRLAEATLVATSRVDVAAVRAADWDAACAPAAGHGEAIGSYAAEQERHQWQQRLQGTDLAQLLGDLRSVFAKEPVDPEALDAAFQNLQWLVKLDPTCAAAIAEQIGTGLLQGNVAAAALSALAAANTDAGQQALTEMRAHGGLDLAIRQAATVAMFQLACPSPRTLSALASDAADASDETGAMLVLGALATRAAAPLADGRTALQALFGLEGETARRGDLPAWLLAVGNAAVPETMAVAGRYLDDEDAAVRAAACTALQNVAGEAAAQALIGRGLADQDAGVRIEAVRALDHRSEPEATAALRRTAAGDVDAEVRSAALRALSRSPANRTALEQAALSDPAETVRDLARHLLQQGA